MNEIQSARTQLQQDMTQEKEGRIPLVVPVSTASKSTSEGQSATASSLATKTNINNHRTAAVDQVSGEEQGGLPQAPNVEEELQLPGGRADRWMREEEEEDLTSSPLIAAASKGDLETVQSLFE